MSNLGLTLCDAVIAIPQDILAGSIASLFDQRVLQESVHIRVGDPKRHMYFEGSFGVPEIEFQNDGQHGPRVRMAFPVLSGVFCGGDVVEYDADDQPKIVKNEKSLTGKVLRYEVPMRTSVHAFHDRELTVQAIYMELTEAKNVDFEALGLDPVEGADLETDLGRKFAYCLKEAIPKTELHTDEQPPRLFIGKVGIPDIADSTGPLQPKTARHSITTGEPVNELDFLLYIYAQEDARLSTVSPTPFSTPWVAERANPASDSVLVLSQSVVIDQLVKPVISAKLLVNNDDLHRNLVVKPPEKGSDYVRVVLDPAPEPSKAKVVVTALEAFVRGGVHDKAVLLDVTFEAKKRESLDLDEKIKASLPSFLQWVPLPDLSLINVIIGQKHNILAELEIVSGERFNLKQSSHSSENLTPDIELDTSGAWYETALKVILTVLAPIFLLIATAVDYLVEGFLDSATIEGMGDNLTQGVNDLAKTVDLPGAAVFKYGNPHFKNGNLVFEGTRIPLPAIHTTTNKPFQSVGMPPEFESFDELPVETTEPVFLGEALIKYPFVHDQELGANQAALSPYYILRREQYWERVDTKKRSGMDTQTLELTTTVGVTQETEKRLTDRLNMSITTNGGLQFKGANLGIETSISRELQLETSQRTSASKEEMVTERVDFPSTNGKPYIVALWALVDRYSLRRMNDTEVIDTYTIRHKNHLLENGFPKMEWIPAAPPSPSGEGTGDGGVVYVDD